MRELCEQDSPVDPRESRFYAVFSRHHREIESILEDDDDEEVGAGDDDDDDMPSAFRCPITFAPMFDPVVAADGHSYDRTALQQWFERGRTTSPMHGGALANQSFVTNQALKSQVAEWLQRRGADQQPGPTTPRSRCASRLAARRSRVHDRSADGRAGPPRQARGRA